MSEINRNSQKAKLIARLQNYVPRYDWPLLDQLALSNGPSERVRLQYEWLAPKLSTEERKSLDVIYAAASSATPEGGKHG